MLPQHSKRRIRSAGRTPSSSSDIGTVKLLLCPYLTQELRLLEETRPWEETGGGGGVGHHFLDGSLHTQHNVRTTIARSSPALVSARPHSRCFPYSSSFKSPMK
jgi:hypothetical protein